VPNPQHARLHVPAAQGRRRKVDVQQGCSTQAAEEALPAGDDDLDGEGAAEARGAAAGVVQLSVKTLPLAGLSDLGDGEEPDGGALAWHL
jgi:hypothetical protein